MIAPDKLLPPLSKADTATFQKLCADFAEAKRVIHAHTNEARVARKKAIREQMRTAPANQLLSLAAEQETLVGSFQNAKRAAKQRMRDDLNPRYAELFPRLIDAAEAHADKLIKRANEAFAKHFESVSATPSGESPIVAFLREWKQRLFQARAGVESAASRGCSPATILPYKVAEEELL